MEDKQFSTFTSMHSEINLEMLEAAYNKGMNRKFIEQLMIQSDDSDYSSIHS